MCLRVKQVKASKAEAPKKCYKIVLISKFVDKYFSPFVLTEIPKEVIAGKKQLKAEQRIEKFKNLIFGGAIHSFKELKDAKDCAIRLKKLCGGIYTIYECNINKGVSFYEGEIEEFVYGYASKELSFVRKLRIKI